MAVWPFNRKKASQVDEQVPEEIREYYESGKKRTAMAWLLALATLLVTVLLALFIFFAGRWVYRQFSNEDEPQQPTTQQTETETPVEQTPNTTNTQQGTSSSSSTQTPSTTPSSTSTQTSSTPSTGATATEVPDTGPGPGGLQ